MVIILFLALLLDFIYLTYEYYDTHFGFHLEKSLCQISSAFDCRAVAASDYSHLFGLPVAIFALWLTVLTAIGYFGVRFFRDSTQRTYQSLFFLGALGLSVGSLVMGLLSLKLQVFCIFCMLGYLLAFLLLWKAYPGRNFSFLRQPKMVLIALVGFIGLSLLTHGMIKDQYGLGKLNEAIQESILDWKAEPLQNFDPKLGIVAGNTESPRMTIVEFADLFCPHCKETDPKFSAFTKARKNVLWVYKSYPLSAVCNPNMPNQGEKTSLRCDWAMALQCTEDLFHRGTEARSWIFEHQETLATQDFQTGFGSYIQNFAFDRAQIESCMGSDEVKSKISAMVKEASIPGFNGTPTIFVNGRKLLRGQLLPVLEQAEKEIGSF